MGCGLKNASRWAMRCENWWVCLHFDSVTQGVGGFIKAPAARRGKGAIHCLYFVVRNCSILPAFCFQSSPAFHSTFQLTM